MVAKPAPSGGATAATGAKQVWPTTRELAAAKDKGLVWVNMNTKLYYAAGEKKFGRTTNSKFMTEAEAKAAGAKAATN